MKQISFLLLLFSVIFMGCGSGDEPTVDPGSIALSGNLKDFGKVGKNAPSVEQELKLTGTKVSGEVDIQLNGDFEFAIGNGSFAKQATLSADQVNGGVKVKIRCAPENIGELEGVISVSGDNFNSVSREMTGMGVEKLVRISTIKKQRHAFGGGNSQKVEDTFKFDVDPTKVENITMYVKLRCPSEGCNAWDMFANIRIQDPVTEKWFELGRYITPYGIDNSQLFKGFPIDVTHFKNMLTGDVKLRSFIEVWGADGWVVSLDFEVIEGTPDYKYYAVTPLLDYANNSLGGIPYGVDNDFVVDKCVTIPANAEETSIRTTITGWGHATPMDADGRPCAEWCFRTHHILIDEEPIFEHALKGIGCNQNEVQPQKGNWQPDRAGWCPGMQVPVRTNVFDYPRAGETFDYKYALEAWTNDMQSTADNKNAYYAITSFIVVKSNEPIEPPVAG